MSSAASRLRHKTMQVAGRWQGTPYCRSLAPGILQGLSSSTTSSEPCCANMALLRSTKVSSIFLKEVLSVLGCLAGQLATDGLKPGEELKPTGTDAPLTHVLDTHVFPEAVELVMKLGLFRGEARN